jgi:hypothetical protein
VFLFRRLVLALDQVLHHRPPRTLPTPRPLPRPLSAAVGRVDRAEGTSGHISCRCPPPRLLVRAAGSQLLAPAARPGWIAGEAARCRLSPLGEIRMRTGERSDHRASGGQPFEVSRIGADDSVLPGGGRGIPAQQVLGDRAELHATQARSVRESEGLVQAGLNSPMVPVNVGIVTMRGR